MHLLLHATLYNRHGWSINLVILLAPQINSYLHVTGQNRLRQRTYSVHNHVKCVRFAGLILNAPCLSSHCGRPCVQLAPCTGV